MKNSVQEAKRYLDNAKEILREKAKKEDGFYQDKKYVKLAGHAAYTGILVALDGLLGVKGKGRKSVDWYLQEIGKLDKKALTSFHTAYDTLHLSMGYDGNQSADISATGLKLAESLINWVETKTAAA
ncbi:DUF5618 family protein [Dyadobacter sp. Leaf189]|uniref:DUF5618 family protein n=1 Tax=Dyadobacter sp. Leaf189 TaxID=1736295 RepID=UPI0006FBD034|nr:DUF5618 family protein [Dyadobacter sp. Leaf189]KQS34163.1 hypothetical protein ASG33_09135 [Dyadobacter sp. Leaf189]